MSKNDWSRRKVQSDSKGMFRHLSAKAIGILIYIICEEPNISAESISQTLKEGESAIATGLRELRERGLLQLKTLRTPDGNFHKSTTVTADGYQFIAKALAQIGPFNSHFLHLFFNPSVSNPAVAGKFLPRADGEIYGVVDASGYEGPTSKEIQIRALETEAEKKLAIKKIQEEKDKWTEKAVKKHKAQFKARSAKPDKRTWTATDISFEFADRVNEIWRVPPWRVTQTRFRMILADMRRRHDTNGHIECAMMDIFFEIENIPDHANGEFLMGRFFYQYSKLLKMVQERGLDLSDEEAAEFRAREEARFRRSRERLRASSDTLKKEL